uniref:Uncharacterized protein n=1 Tax=Trypanosoma congolense (strain IL3000) TaxID=1068625 RepID=G0V065_TRYCI|nr:conserved hypothetical protein [Trypanosoma congolense IL3000]
MNVDDLFADDLKSLDTFMAQVSKPPGKSISVPATSSLGIPDEPAPIGGLSFDDSERVGRRAGRRQQGLGSRTETAEPVKTPAVDVLPWELDDDAPPPPAAKAEPAPAPSLAVATGRRSGAPRATATATTPAPQAKASSGLPWDDDDDYNSGNTAVGGRNNNSDDPFSLLEGPASSTNKPLADVGAEPVSATPWDKGSEEAKRRTEQRDLLSSLDAVDIELQETNTAIDLLQIKSDAELTELETSLIKKQMELESAEATAASEQLLFEEQHRRSIESLQESTKRLLKQQAEEVSASTNELYEGQLRSFVANVEGVRGRIERLQQQRELLLQNHRFDEKGILVALIDEEENSPASNIASDGANGGVGLEAKMSAALRIFQQWSNKQLCAIAQDVVEHLHKETSDVVYEIRKNRELAFLQNAADRKEMFNEFLREMISDYRDFFETRAQQKVKNAAVLREGLREASQKLRELSERRLQSRMHEATAKAAESSRRFQSLTLEAVDCAQRKNAALRESDGSVARSQYVEQQQRCEMELSVLEKLHKSERCTLKEQLDRLRKAGLEDTNQQKQIKSLCTAKAELVVAAIRELENSVKEQLGKQSRRTVSLCPEPEGVMRLVDDEMADVCMAVQEKEAVIASLIGDAQKRQNELCRTRLRCDELREQITEKIQDAVHYARQHRASHESYLSSVDLLRTAWEREQRELLHWGYEVLPLQNVIGDCDVTDACGSLSEVGRTQFPMASTNMCALRYIADRSRAFVLQRKKLVAQRRQIYNTIEQESARLAAARRGNDKNWVQLLEELLVLMGEQEKAASQHMSMASSIAKLEGAKLILDHDIELFKKRRADVQETLSSLKQEVQLTSQQRNSLALLQKDLQRRVTVWRDNHRSSENLSPMTSM